MLIRDGESVRDMQRTAAACATAIFGDEAKAGMERIVDDFTKRATAPFSSRAVSEAAYMERVKRDFRMNERLNMGFDNLEKRGLPWTITYVPPKVGTLVSGGP